jgi:wobble nucleotide-excising tRNase
VAPKITIAAQGDTLRKYIKTNAEKAYNALSRKVLLTLDELAEASKAIKQSAMNKLSERLSSQVQFNDGEKPLFEALDIQTVVVSNILQKSATSSAIARLKENPALASWVEEGRKIHTHSVGEKCEYCQQVVPREREAELAKHFNTSDANLKREIERAIAFTDKIILEVERIAGLSNEVFYPEFREDFKIHFNVLTRLQLDVIKYLETLKKSLEDKLTRRTESYDTEFSSMNEALWNKTLFSINALIKRHNTETDNFQKRIDDSFTKIETHFLSEIDSEVKNLDSKIEATEENIRICTEGVHDINTLGVDGLQERITKNRAKISNTQQAATNLSQKLAAFLGREDLKFEPEGNGYRIMRFGRAAKRLSEGEKTAITFLYFVVGLEDQEFDLNEGIVVVDDPISSLDSSSIYQAFGYLKNAVKDAKQIFLLTHNFEFLKLLINWFQNIRKSEGKATYWMLHCKAAMDLSRETEIHWLDKVLLENKNEFAFLLKELTAFSTDGTIEQSYPIPNIIRKVLETFLEQHSTGKGIYQKLDNIKFDPAKKSALYKYANDLSHPTLSGLDPSLVGETQTNIKHLLEMIDFVAPAHYRALTDTIST